MRKKIDHLSRIAIPKKALSRLGWSGKEVWVEVILNEETNTITLKREEPLCYFCGSQWELVKTKKEIYICKNCLREMLSQSKNNADLLQTAP